MSDSDTYDVEQARQLMAQIEHQMVQQGKDLQQRLSSLQGASASLHRPTGHHDLTPTSDAEFGWKHAFYALRRYRRSV